MKKTLVTTIAFTSLFAFNAQAYDFNNEQCNVDLNGDIKFSEKILSLKTKSERIVKITPDYSLYLDGKAVSLSAQEQKWVAQYYNEIQDSIPQVMTVAAEGVKIANFAVSEVLRGFLGEDSLAATNMEDKLDSLYTGLKSHVYKNPDYLTFDTQVIEDDLGLGANFDEEIDQFVSEIIEQAMGEFFIQMGKNMLSGEGDTSMTSFEARMEKMGEAIETKVEGQGEMLKRETEKLCEMISTIDATESNIQKIRGLSDLDLITFNDKA
ncbi:YggN family protein [Glaciecola sp. MH2013]|uniref:YggN family protein n=1 Tax=Glaciecola sp. MH2013 TaxID=2785524 RepID=UPI0018A1024C|nr:YggN family protein [Glaciecola sp. MH2013]MBF7074987.1 YggN family protein [Glaciecola sp. MH2013]